MAVCLVAASAMLASLPGCGGCRQDPAQAQKDREKEEAEKRAKKEEKPKPNFELSRLATRPAAPQTGEEPDPLGPPCKPGHWTATTLAAKANNFDFVGDLEIAAIDRHNDEVALEGSPFRLLTTRQISLPKRQPKLFESVLFVPPTERQPLLSSRLNWGKGGQLAWENQHRVSLMPSYQYHFVVLARYPERYSYLKRLVAVEPLSDALATGTDRPYYRISAFRADKVTRQIDLPSYGLLWSSIAYLLWDDAVPGCLSLEQQQAMLDWLHWGGQLILSGPETLDSLRDSFLAEYLPAASAGGRDMQEADFEALRRWSGKSTPSLRPAAKRTGITLKLLAHGRFVPGSGDLLAERRVGRGRIVVSAFRLYGGELTTWPAWDEVVNACLLRRGPRRFIENQDLALQTTWTDGGHRLDARRVCHLRYFTRDAGVTMASYGADVFRSDSDVAWSGLSEDEVSVGPGVAAWNDSGPIAQAARTALRSAAQIEVPERRFVLWMVAGYLAVLVPVNWVVFRLLGRVEWAWIAAPVIAVVCTIVVVRAAQLDIGFARSRTEIDLVEIQPDYPRAHVSRYTALYTSLTTLYDFHFEDPGALVLPFPTVAGAGRFSDWRAVVYRRGQEAVLQDYFVRSNSTGMVHSEHMVDVGGSLALRENPDGGLELVNGTNLDLYGVAVIQRDGAGQLRTGGLERLEPGATGPLRLRPVSPQSPDAVLWSDLPQGVARTGRRLEPGELDLRGLVRWALGASERMGTGSLELSKRPGTGQSGEVPVPAVSPGISQFQVEAGFSELEPGQARVIAALDEEPPGPTIQPGAPQAHVAGLVVAHLRYAPLKDPEPDANVPSRRPLPPENEAESGNEEPPDGFDEPLSP